LIVPLYLTVRAYGCSTISAALVVLISLSRCVHDLAAEKYFQAIPRIAGRTAMVDGCNCGTCCTPYCFQLQAPGLVAAAMFAFMTWSDYLFPYPTSTIASKTMPVLSRVATT